MKKSGQQIAEAGAGLPGGTSTTGSNNHELGKKIAAAQAAMQEAGRALEEAGGMLESASTPEEMAAAEAALADARLAVLVAGEDLRQAKAAAEQSGDSQAAADIGNSESILDNANLAIVLAGQTVFSNGVNFPMPGLPGIPGLGDSVLDAELDESIAIFEGQIIEARRGVINSSPASTSPDRVPGVAGLGEGSNEDAATDKPASPDNRTLAGTAPAHEDSRNPAEQSSEPPALPPVASVTVPDDLPDPQGDDIVARQLREAATAESDPALREKLWEEYRKYRAGL